MTKYTYGLLVENKPERFLHQESTYFKSPFKRTKYAIIEKGVCKDGSELVLRIIYSNDLYTLREKLLKYISWYDYVDMNTKNIQGYITKLS